MNEADTCGTYMLLKLKASGWEDETHALSPIWMVTSSGDLRQAKFHALMSVLDRAFKGKL